MVVCVRWWRDGVLTGAGVVVGTDRVLLPCVPVVAGVDVAGTVVALSSDDTVAPACVELRPGCAAATIPATTAVPATPAAAAHLVMRATRARPSFLRWTELMRSGCPFGAKAP